MRLACVAVILACISLPAWAGEALDPTAVERGKQALLGRHFNAPTISLTAYDNLWRHWDSKPKERPASYDQAVRDYYGLHAAPYPNGRYPMGLREAPLLVLGKGLATDCMLCHGGSILGQSHVGLGNVTLDLQAFFSDLAKADGHSGRTPFTFANVRGTTEAGGFSVFLLGLREPDLRLRTQRLDLGLHDDMCEDPPPWWALKKKRTMYHTGGANARSVRSIMQFMMSPLTLPSTFEKEEASFVDIQQYLLSLEAPKYPFPIDAALAAKGEKLFTQTCVRCHGTYGPDGKYPNKIVPLQEIGTDRARYDGITPEFVAYYNKSWFAQEQQGWLADGFTSRRTEGYQAPPLDGVWATAPYFHNGSTPTLADVLNSRQRPRIFTRSYRTGDADYDRAKVGWRVQVLDRPADPNLSPTERRKVYDTTQPGRGNGGHTYGDHFSDEERRAVIEFLKTL